MLHGAFGEEKGGWTDRFNNSHCIPQSSTLPDKNREELQAAIDKFIPVCSKTLAKPGQVISIPLKDAHPGYCRGSAIEPKEMRLFSIFDLQEATRNGAFDSCKLDSFFGKQSIDQLYDIADEHEQIKVHLVAIGSVKPYYQVDVLNHASLALVDTKEPQSLHPTVITHLHSKDLGSFGRKCGQATLALQFHYVFSMFMGAGSAIFCTVKRGKDDLVGEQGFYPKRGYKKCKSQGTDHGCNHVSTFTEEHASELWSSDKFPSSHNNNVHIRSETQHNVQIRSFNGDLLKAARKALPNNVSSVLPKFEQKACGHPSRSASHVSNNFKDVKEHADKTLLSMRQAVHCDSQNSPCLDRLVAILSQSEIPFLVDYFHCFVDYNRETDLMVASFSKMRTYILHCCEDSDNSMFMTYHKALFVQSENSPRAEDTPSGGHRMVLLVHASKLLDTDDINADDIHALGSDMSVISAITYSCDKATGVSFHSNYMNDYDYGRNVSFVNQYLWRAILLSSGEAEDSVLSEKIAGFDETPLLKDVYSASSIYEKYVNHCNNTGVLDKISDTDFKYFEGEEYSSFIKFVKGPSANRFKEDEEICSFKEDKESYSDKVSRFSEDWDYTTVKPIEFHPGVIVGDSSGDKSEWSVSLSLLMELFYTSSFPNPVYSPLAVFLFEDLSIGVSKDADDQCTRFILKCNRCKSTIDSEETFSGLLHIAYELSMWHHQVDSCHCKPTDRVCVGSDDLFLGSYLTWEKDISNSNGIRQFALFVLSLKLCSESQGTDLNEHFCRALLGERDIIHDNGGIIPSLETAIVEDSSSEKVKVLNENDKLLVNAESICVVDWKDDSLPQTIPVFFKDENCMDHLKTMLSEVKSTNDGRAGIHNLGLLPYYMNACDERERTSQEYRAYKALPSVSLGHAFSCSNECKHLYSHVGRSIKTSSKVFVVQSTLHRRCLNNGHSVCNNEMRIVHKDKNTVTVQWICDRLGLDNILGKSFLDQLSHNKWMELTEEQKSGLKYAMGVQDNTDGNLIVQQLTPFRAKIRFRDSSISSVFLNFAKATVSIQNDFLKYQKEFEKVMCSALLGLEERQATYEGAERVDDNEQFTDGNDGGFGKGPELRRSKRSKPGDTGEKKIADLEGSGTDRPGAKRQCNERTQPIPRKKGKTFFI